jgi:hypothetical protein
VATAKKPKIEAAQASKYNIELQERDSNLDPKTSYSRMISSKKGSTNPLPVLPFIGVSAQVREGKQWKRVGRRSISEGQQGFSTTQDHVSSEVPMEDRLVAMDVRYRPIFFRGNTVEAEAVEQPHRSL